MKALLQEIENNLATLKCRLEEEGISVMMIQANLWGSDREFKVGIWNGTMWLTCDDVLAYNHSIQDFIGVIKRKIILGRKFTGSYLKNITSRG